MSSEELAKMFSDIAPVRHCFTVKQSGSDLNRGFGYVVFALKEDAERAIKQFDSKLYKGRTLKVHIADKRPPKEERLAKRQLKKSAKTTDDEDMGDADEHEAEPPPPQPKTRQQHREHAPTAKKPPPPPAPPTPAKAALDPAKAEALSKMTKKERYQAFLAATDTEPDVRTVIVTDLPADVTKQHLYQKCRKAGTIVSLVFPVPDIQQLAALVTYATLGEAQTAVAKLHLHEMHGATLCAALKRSQKAVLSGKAKVSARRESRLIVRNLAWTVDEKVLHNKFGRFGKIVEAKIVKDEESQRSKGYGFIQFNTTDAASKAVKEMHGTELAGRKINVAWSKKSKVDGKDADRGKAEGKGQEGEKEQEEEEQDEEEEEGAEGDDEEEAETGKEEDMNKAEAEMDDEGEEDDGAAAEEAPAPKKAAEPDVHEGKTLFVQNISMEVSEPDVKKVFQEFGPLVYVALVKDRETGMPKGTGFVKFKSKEAAEACFERANSQVLDPLELDERPLKVSRAVDKSMLDKSAADKNKKTDKRRHYLALEGAIAPGTKAYEELSENDKNRRAALDAEAQEKMKNVNYAVSTTRLSVHNLPRTCNSQQLRELFDKFAGRMRTKQIKVVTHKDQFEDDGTPRSKCFGFVEYYTHEDALKALRAFNNNPEVFGPARRPIVAFAFEDARVLHTRKLRHERLMRRRAQLSSSAAAPADGAEQQGKKEKRYGKRKPQDRQKKAEEGGAAAVGEAEASRDGQRRPKKPKPTVVREPADSPWQKPAPAPVSSAALPHKGKRKAADPALEARAAPSAKKTKQHVHPLTALAQLGTGAALDPDRKPRRAHKKEKQNAEEQKFEDIVSRYREKLATSATGESSKRWFEA